MGIYVVVARARASAIFGLGDSFSVPVQFPGREPFTLTFQTTYGTGFEVPFPKDFYVDARGAAKERSEAVELFINTALGVTCMIALITNAYMGHLEPELIFDATPELGEHEYVQSFVADLPITTVPGRRIDMDVLRATIEAWNTHPRKDRLLRATVQYVEALRSWRPGYEITCLAHLYMGVEAATKAVLSEHLHKSGLSKDEIQDQWKVDQGIRQRGASTAHFSRRHNVLQKGEGGE